MIRNLTGKELESFKENFKVEGYFAPTVFESTLDSRKFCICIGTPWIEIPRQMTSADVHSKWTRKEFHKPKTEYETTIKSSRGKTEYKVQFSERKWNCSCSGFKFRKTCSHITSAKDILYSKLTN